MKSLSLLVTLASTALAQSVAPAYGQCGGQGWTGPTTCESGWTCTYSNQWYSQCLPGGAASSTTTKTTLATSTATSTSSKTSTTGSQPTGFKWFGVGESVAEFGQGNYPGTWGVHFRFPELSTIDTLIGEGMNIFRVGFSMERLAVNSMTETFAAAYLANLTETINHITSKGAYAVLDPHNFGRYKGNVITDVTGFGTFWKNLATPFKSNSLVIFDTNNEYHDMDQTLVLNLNQAAINAIRGVGATSQYIFVEGNAWSGAWSWTSTNDNLKALTDPQNKLVYEMHQYLDSDKSGTHPECVSTTIGVESVKDATTWLRNNGKIGVLGEFAGASNSVCKEAVTGLLKHLSENSDVWSGALWWAAGPWWGDYMFSYEPPSGAAYTYYGSLLRQYA
ncbi:unnamed protein product [Clonostachys rhizophaga]|uniref:cellulase n=1 Tax=Clonostachys rhizophaga TaxID=160324 RepID=A0A9N9VWE2_9HYPO|nr:unnamed protein product [Clonostachys rhizophaga]